MVMLLLLLLLLLLLITMDDPRQGGLLVMNDPRGDHYSKIVMEDPVPNFLLCVLSNCVYM